MKHLYAIFLMFLLSISIAVTRTDGVESMGPNVNLLDLDLDSLYNAPAAKIKLVIKHVDELILHAKNHETSMANNITKWRNDYLKKKAAHEKAIKVQLYKDHVATLSMSEAKTTVSNLKKAVDSSNRHYKFAKGLQSSSDVGSTLKALHLVRSILGKLLTGTHYPTTSPTTSPTYTPTTSPTKWVAPTPPTASPTVSPTAKPFVKVGLSNTANRSVHCKMSGEYISVAANAVCNIADTNGNDILVDYTKHMFTKYTFVLKMTPGNAHNGDVSPHGGFEPCNTQGNANTRTGSPEMWFIDRAGDWGYGTYWGGWGHAALYKNKSYYGAADPNGGGDHKWSVVMKYFGGSYKLYSWTVDGVDFSKYRGKNSGCSSDGNPINYIVRIWAYPRSTFNLKNFNFCQADKIGDLC